MFTLIIPIYNAIGYLDRCLESLSAQTCGAFEAILVDDGSLDGSGELCEHYAARDSRFRVSHQENRGVSGARNAGLMAAKNEYILFVDADDWLAPEALATLAAATEAYPQADFWQFGYGENNFPDEVVVQAGDPYASMAAYARKHSCCMVWLMLFRRRLIVQERLQFPEGIRCAEDQAFLLQYQALSRSAVYLPQPLYHYRVHPQSAMGGAMPMPKLRGYVQDHFLVVTLLQDFFRARSIRPEPWLAGRLQQLVKAGLLLLARHRSDRKTWSLATDWLRAAWRHSQGPGETSYLNDWGLRLARLHVGYYVVAVRGFWRLQAFRRRWAGSTGERSVACRS